MICRADARDADNASAEGAPGNDEASAVYTIDGVVADAATAEIATTNAYSFFMKMFVD